MAKKSKIDIVPQSSEISPKKKDAFEMARNQIEREFGKSALIRLGDKTIDPSLATIPSGSILLDEALGVGGYPKGRIIEIYGPESSGKTTLALHAIAEAQKAGGLAAFVDAEHALDPTYAKSLGVDVDNLWLSQPDCGEQALEIVEYLVRSGAVDIIVVDSVAALTPQAEIDGEMGDAHVGLQARLMSQALRKLTSIIAKSGSCLFFINQLRMKIGIAYGNPEVTTGGTALKFYTTLRIEVRKGEVVAKTGEDASGHKMMVKIIKNKVAPPGRKVELELVYGKGISGVASLLDAAVKYNLIQKSGSWFSYQEEKIGQGRDAAKKYLENNPAIAQELLDKLHVMLFENRLGSTEPDIDVKDAPPEQ